MNVSTLCEYSERISALDVSARNGCDAARQVNKSNGCCDRDAQNFR